MPVSEETYRAVSLEDGETTWELVCGRLRAKPAMTHAHNDVTAELAFILRRQLDRSQYRVRVDGSRARVATGTWFVPDVAVVPAELTTPHMGEQSVLEAYSEALPLVVEVWSPSTGEYDVDTKLPEYRRRGDVEIWRVHPYERTVTTWRRQPSGEYAETRYAGTDIVPVASLPGVEVRLAELFAD
ncbi:MAG: Uma2 family endonuclease [Dehalococcoidia bacterium]|nr:Uma2 family endonuclease [Dehalococcoidia bacterium]